MDALATYRLTRLVTADVISEPLGRSLVGRSLPTPLGSLAETGTAQAIVDDLDDAPRGARLLTFRWYGSCGPGWHRCSNRPWTHRCRRCLIVLDCQDLTYIDSSGVNVLIRAWGRVPQVLRVLEIYGFTELNIIE